MVHTVLYVLASGAARAGSLPLHLADSFALPHRGHRRGRSFVAREIDLFPSGPLIARTAHGLTNFRLLLPQ